MLSIVFRNDRQSQTAIDYSDHEKGLQLNCRYCNVQ
jgi:hypothetical protein